MRQDWHIASENELIADVRWFPVDLDKRTGAIQFANVAGKRPKWRNFIGGTTGGEREEPEHKSLSAQTAFKFVARERVPPRINFIWNTAYCCSTAIARALDVPGRNLTIHEPVLMASVATARREAQKAGRGDISWISDAAFKLLGRPLAEGTTVTLKPAPESSYLVPDAAAKTRGKMLFLYSDCRSFLRACMRYNEGRLSFVRRLFNAIREDGVGQHRWTAESVVNLTDIEIAGLTWQLQIAAFGEYLKRYGDRAMSLDCDAFLADPKDVLTRLWDFFELPGDVEESDAFQDPGFFARHAKYPEEAFTIDLPHAADDALHPRIVEQIERMAEASMALLPKGALPLPNPIAVAAKSYG